VAHTKIQGVLGGTPAYDLVRPPNLVRFVDRGDGSGSYWADKPDSCIRHRFIRGLAYPRVGIVGKLESGDEQPYNLA
jgi:hypothetical protein